MSLKSTKSFLTGLVVLIASLTLVLPLWALDDSRNPEDWYQRAYEDLKMAEMAYEDTDYYDQICFLSHQAIEKMLKGLLIENNIVPERTHLTTKLLRRLSAHRPDLEDQFEDFRKLDRIYIPSRYPKIGYSFTQAKAVSCFETAKGFSEKIEWIGSEAKPFSSFRNE